MAPIIEAYKLSKRYGTKVLFEELSFTIEEGEKYALVAPNGSGKSSLLKIIAGVDTPDLNSNGESGTVSYFGETPIGYLEQEPQFDLNREVIDEVSRGVRVIVGEEWRAQQRAKEILSLIKIDQFEKRLGELSGGELKRVSLAKLIVAEPRFIILDEPTNHLDIEVIEFLEGYLRRARTTLLMVTHDRYFLERVTNIILELEGGLLHSYNGNYSYFLEKRRERHENYSSELERSKNLFRRELEWMRREPQARGKKAKYRVDAFYQLQERTRVRREEGRLKIGAAMERLGRKVVNCKELSFSYGERAIVEGFSYNFAKGEKIGVVGPNGVGKSTLLELISGLKEPSSGEIEFGESVKFGYYRQSGIEFNNEERVIEALERVAEVVRLDDGTLLTAAQFLTRFLFPHSMHNNRIESLSGGEKRRLYLLTILMRNPNFLILDEPTNDLDLVTLNLLEEYLQNYRGSLLVVSHDRYFLDKVVDELFIFEGDGLINGFVGQYSEWIESKREREKREKSESERVSKGREERERAPRERERRISYKERREMESIEAEMESLAKKKSTLMAALNSGTLPAEELNNNSKELAQLLERLDFLELRWLELSEISE